MKKKCIHHDEEQRLDFQEDITIFCFIVMRISKVNVISTRNLNDEQIAVNEYFE